MAEHILNAEDIRGIFLLIDDCEQNCLSLISAYNEKLCQKNYSVQIVNSSRPDILQSVAIASPFWPPNVSVSQASTVLVLHSVEVLMALANVDFQTVFKQLITWLSCDNVSQIVLSVNREVTTSEELQKLEFLCSQRLDLLERKGNEFKVETLWKKPRGKAVLQKELLIIENSRLMKCSIIKDSVVPKNPTVEPTNLLADLTFNVNISVEERKEKDNLVLPYTECGKITYTLDREDDFDEEDDPDEDLQI